MKKYLTMLLIFLLVPVVFSQFVTLENPTSRIIISLSGGKINSFQLKDMGLNPIHSYGHFICFDRWGPSTDEETALGIPWHGEGSNVKWMLDQKPVEKSNFIFTEMSCVLPIVKMGMKRKMYLDKNNAIVKVTETVTNMADSTRYYNLVQHATIGTPFLDETTMVDTHVLKGFDQDGPIPPTDTDILGWPDIVLDGDSLNTRFLNSSWPDQTVFSYILHENDEYGWITAVNPTKGLLIGYVWSTDDYPWLDLWQNLRNSSPYARGFEFGTTGLHQPWPTILETGTIFDHELLEYLAPEESVTKSYTSFLAKIPQDYQGVENVAVDGNTITIIEYGQDPDRNIVIDLETINTSIESDNDVSNPTGHNLMQNYPNPFNASTRLEYSLQQAGQVNIALYNINGQKVKTLVNKFQAAKQHQLNFTANELSSGIYFCSMTVDGQVMDNRKILLQK